LFKVRSEADVIGHADRFVEIRQVMNTMLLVMTGLGYIPVMMQSGICKYTRENSSIEFVVHRNGGSDQDVVAVKSWNVTAVPLPFVNILLDFPFTADFGGFRLKAPVPEAYVVQKMLIAQRRQGESRRDKDLEQCSVIAERADDERLAAVVGSFRFDN